MPTIRRRASAAPARLLTFAAAGVAVVAGGFWGVGGLLANPVRSVEPGGLAQLQGNWEPYQCRPDCGGYLQAGGRSIYVQLPAGCQAPARASTVTITARRDPQLGSNAYRATGCAS